METEADSEAAETMTPQGSVDLRPLEITQFKVPQLPLKGGGDSSSSNAVDEEEEDAKAVGHVDTVEPVGMEETVDKPRAHKDKDPAAAPANANYYQPPDWASLCPPGSGYQLEVIKNGRPLLEDTVVLSDCDHCLFGRQPRSSLNPSGTGKATTMLHPSLSRVHAVLQYGSGPKKSGNSEDPAQSSGWFICDLKSTHGTFVNKHKAPAHRYLRLRVGHVFRFGNSTRLFLLQGPDTDVEPETSESWSELVAAHAKRKAEREARAKKMMEEDRLGKRLAGTEGETSGESISIGCSWGIRDEDDEEGAANGPNFLSQLGSAGGASCLSHENAYMDDPKRALKAYFDREGIDPPPDYEFVDGRFGQQMCRLELPLSVETVYAEVPVTGRKRKEAIAACALEACRLLDRLGEFDANNEGAEAVKRAREKEYWKANDYYSSDEDAFLDRTGHIEQRRKKRMRKMGVEEGADNADQNTKANEAPANQDSLTMLAELEKIGKEIIEVEKELNAAEKAMEADGDNASEMDALEAYMEAIKRGAPNRAARQQLKRRLFTLRQAESRLLRRLGIRNKAGVFCSSASSVCASAVKATMATAPHDGMGEQQQRNSETKLNAIKRLLPKVPHDGQPAKAVNENDAFVPEVDDADDEGVQDTPEAKIPADSTNGHISSHSDKSVRHPPPAPETARTRQKEQKEPKCRPAAAHDRTRSPPPDAKGKVENVEETVQKTLVPIGPAKPTPEAHAPDDANQDYKQPPPATEPEELGDYDSMNNPDYALWVPPADQTGDGMTELNQRYGY